MGHQAIHLLVTVLACFLFDGIESQRTVTCPNSNSLLGYVDLAAINDDMQDELGRIVASGIVPLLPYDYILCPDTTLDGSVTLKPVLSQTRFLCGEGGLSRTCIISGGTQQVLIAESTDPMYPIESATFVGITFSAFGGASISAYASNVTAAAFADCTWSNWDSPVAIDVAYTSDPATGSIGEGMTLLITDCFVANATGSVAISNDNAEIIITGLDVSDTALVTLLSTRNSGLSDVDLLVVTKCDMNSVTLTTTSGQLIIRASMIIDNNRFSGVFVTQDAGTIMTIDNVEVLQNTKILEAWNAVFINASSIGEIANSRFEGNSNMESAVTASLSSRARISDTIISSNNGTFPSVSSPAFAISDAFISLERVSLLDNNLYTAAIFAIFRSEASFNETCIEGGTSSTVIFIGDECRFSLDASTNYIADHTSDACDDSPGLRLFLEDEDSKCFVGTPGGPSNCTGTCREAATATFCVNDDTVPPISTSDPPTTIEPSVSPLIAPVVPATSAPVVIMTPAPVIMTPAPMATPSLSPIVVPTISPSVTDPSIAKTVTPTCTDGKKGKSKKGKSKKGKGKKSKGKKGKGKTSKGKKGKGPKSKGKKSEKGHDGDKGIDGHGGEGGKRPLFGALPSTFGGEQIQYNGNLKLPSIFKTIHYENGHLRNR